MIVDYNKDKRVRITKPGIFDNAIGTIKSIKIEVDFGALGCWSFTPNEMELSYLSHIKEVKTDSTDVIMSDNAGNSVKNVLEKPAKRTYKKREPKASDKPKRKYTKKAKS
jgi:hypothetical protein